MSRARESRRFLLAARWRLACDRRVVAVWIGLRIGGAEDGALGRRSRDSAGGADRLRAVLSGRRRQGGRMRAFWALLGCATGVLDARRGHLGRLRADLAQGSARALVGGRRLPLCDPARRRGAGRAPGDERQPHAQGAVGARRPRDRDGAAVPQLDARPRSAVAEHRPRRPGRASSRSPIPSATS